MKRSILLFFCSLWIVNAYSQEEDYSIGKICTINSEVLDENRKIAIYTPSDYEDSQSRYQVLYVLDGEWNFPFVAAVTDKLRSSGDIPPTIVVGIMNTNRNRDLTPSGKHDNKMRFGGAENFLRFLTEELQAWINDRYRTHPHSVLAGHSFGGLFTIYAMMNKPDAFQSYLALSPSLGRNDEQQVKIAQEFFSRTDTANMALYLAIANEGGYTKISSEKFRDIVNEFLPSRMRFTFESLPEENHVSITTTGFLRGIKFLYEGYNVEKFPELDDIFLIESHFAKLSKRYGYSIPVPENYYQKFVKEQVAEREYEYALFILKKYEEAYPNSPYLLAHYAETYLLMGNFTQAEAYFSRLKEIGIEDERLNLLLQKLKKE